MRTFIPLTAIVLAGCSSALAGNSASENSAQTADDQKAQAATGTLDESNDDPGKLATYFAGGTIDTSSNNAFFASLGTNGRTCNTCHIEGSAWTITPADAAAALKNSKKSVDPMFAPVDGADCQVTSNTNPSSGLTMLLNYALIRIGLPVPANAEYSLTGVQDPHHCATPPSAAQLSLFRRPPPVANVAFLSTVMWDARENVTTTIDGDLQHQANDATLTHAMAATNITAAQAQQAVSFVTQLFTAQATIQKGGPRVDLISEANGGPEYLASTVQPAFFLGINDSLGHNPQGLPFNPVVFTIYSGFEPSASGAASLGAREQSIGRGEALFNSHTFTISDVPGLNGPNDASQAPISGATCTTCHDTPNVGNHSLSLALDIGVTSPTPVGGVLDVANLPVYTFTNNASGATMSVTDPGRGLITGKWKDLGKTKGPILRGLSARAPYFHNGSAKDLPTLVSFYNVRFNLGLSANDQADLVAFLSAL